jgi:hypothetical protein
MSRDILFCLVDLALTANGSVLFKDRFYGNQMHFIGGKMFSGIQEILVLVVIILGILFLPRILSRGQGKSPAVPRPAIVISGKMRLAIAASLLWPAVMAVFMQPWQKDLFHYAIIGIGPVVLAWIIYWVCTGFRQK